MYTLVCLLPYDTGGLNEERKQVCFVVTQQLQGLQVFDDVKTESDKHNITRVLMSPAEELFFVVELSSELEINC